MGASLNVICKNAWNFKGKFLTQLTPIVQASLSTLAVLDEKIASIPTLFPFELKDNANNPHLMEYMITNKLIP